VSPRLGAGKPDVLTRIMRERRQDVAEARRRVPLKELLWEAEKRTHHSLVGRLAGGEGCRVVAEVKKASPSAGLLRTGFDPAALAREYVRAGAVGISVLTEPRHFLGSEEDLRAVRSAVEVPILRKDFISEPYQLAEAAAWGADVILLIVAGLDPALCVTLHRESVELGLEALVEVHTREELAVALECEGALIGVNSRNLKTLTTDLGVARDLAGEIPEDRWCIAESGIRTADDLKRLSGAGYDGFLIGESLLRQPSPGEALMTLISGTR
jgi:indole-3-glycerol phosphate synthase